MSKLTLYFLAGLMAIVAFGCMPPPPDGGDNTLENHNVNNIFFPGAGGPSPSPSPGAIARVGIGVFGEGNCDPGKVPAGAERDNDLRAGCVANVTCSPFDAQGTEMFPPNIPAAPARFVAISGEGTIVRSSQPSNPYNLDVRGLAAGAAVFECVVGNASSNAAPNGPFRITVLN